jgi:NADPH-dependent curcumin reductase CurA
MRFKKYVLKHFPTKDFPEDLSCFDLTEADTEDLPISEGQALVQVIWISSDPLLRTWISGARSYLDPVAPGSPIPGFGVGKVIELKKVKGKRTILEEGDWVVGMLEWSQYMRCDYKIIQKLPVDVRIALSSWETICISSLLSMVPLASLLSGASNVR